MNAVVVGEVIDAADCNQEEQVAGLNGGLEVARNVVAESEGEERGSHLTVHPFNVVRGTRQEVRVKATLRIESVADEAVEVKAGHDARGRRRCGDVDLVDDEVKGFPVPFNEHPGAVPASRFDASASASPIVDASIDASIVPTPSLPPQAVSRKMPTNPGRMLIVRRLS